MAKKAPYLGDPIDLIRDYVFNQVSDFFDLQATSYVDWKHDRFHRRAYAGMKEIRTWWRVQRPVLEKEQFKDKLSPMRFKKGPGRHWTLLPTKGKDRKILDRMHKIERQIWETDQKMLLKAVRLRKFLWD